MRVLITGTSRGIGRAIAEKFLQMGHSVIGIDVKASPITHERFSFLHADIRSMDLPEIPPVEILINNAGTLVETEALEVNLTATIALTEKILPQDSLRSILLLASASARNGAEFPRYVASKAGLVGYMKYLAGKVAERGITCNSISPGGVITPANAHILENEELYAAVKRETLLGKWAEPEEIAELAYYLTVINRSMTGEDLLIDNGEMLKSNFIW